MNNFLFITHLTPSNKLSSLRKDLIDVYLKALNNQTYPNWKVLLMGEKEEVNGKFKEVYLPDTDFEQSFKNIKILLQRNDVVEYLKDVDYIVKLDEDDIFSTTALEKLKNTTADFIGNKSTVVHDITSGKVTDIQFQFYAGTYIHKKEHALASYTGQGSVGVGNVFYADHSKAWHLYYANKKTEAFNIQNPLYIWTLSPTSISASNFNNVPKRMADISFPKYYKFLRVFSPWVNFQIQEFNTYLKLQTTAWQKFSNLPLKPIPYTSKPYFFLRKVKYKILNTIKA